MEDDVEYEYLSDLQALSPSQSVLIIYGIRGLIQQRLVCTLRACECVCSARPGRPPSPSPATANSRQHVGSPGSSSSTAMATACESPHGSRTLATSIWSPGLTPDEPWRMSEQDRGGNMCTDTNNGHRAHILIVINNMTQELPEHKHHCPNFSIFIQVYVYLCGAESVFQCSKKGHTS